MEIFNIEVVDSHLIWPLNNKRILIDTGSPWSFGRSVRLFNREIVLPETCAGLNPENMVCRSSIKIDTVLGCDILAGMAVRFDVQNSELAVAPTGAAVPGIPLRISLDKGRPVLPVTFGSREYAACLDSRTRLSYAPRALLDEFPLVGNCDDFYPLFGNFITPVHEIPVGLAGREIRVSCGCLPDLLQMALNRMGAAPCTVGHDLFHQTRLFVDISQRMAGVEWNAS